MNGNEQKPVYDNEFDVIFNNAQDFIPDSADPDFIDAEELSALDEEDGGDVDELDEMDIDGIESSNEYVAENDEAAETMDKPETKNELEFDTLSNDEIDFGALPEFESPEGLPAFEALPGIDE